MADESIYAPEEGKESTQQPTSDENLYLLRKNYLKEYKDLGESAVALVRENLNVPSTDSVYSKDDVDIELSKRITNTIQEYLKLEDPHGILPKVVDMITGMVKSDGSVPFTSPLSGNYEPTSDQHLTTKKFVERLLKDHINAEDPHDTLLEVQDILEKYVKLSDVYTKSLVYTKSELDKLLSDYLRKDGSTPFTKPLGGVDPQIDSQLATKRYADKILYNHIVSVDPHNFLSILNNRLASYIKKVDVYDRTLTYSRTLIDDIIQNIVNQSISAAIADYMDSVNDKFEYIRKQRFIKQDGSIPFKNPLIGVNAKNSNELTTLQLVQDLIDVLKGSLESKIENKECEWVTSGPVIGSAGLVEVGTEFAQTVSLQEIMDAIFYGKGVNIIAPEHGPVGESVEVTVCVQGSLAELERAELYQNGKVIAYFTKEDFEKLTCITILSDPVDGDTEFIFKAYYVNGSTHEVTALTKVSLPVFVGLLPQTRQGYTVSYEYLVYLTNLDKVNNKFYYLGSDLTSVNHRYEYNGEEWKLYILAIPEKYPDLYQMHTPSQLLGIAAFDVIDKIPFLLPNLESDVIYTLYILREPLMRANLPVTFNLINNE